MTQRHRPRIVASIAHDLNNLLTVIGVNAGFLVRELPSGQTRTAARAIVEAVGLAAALTEPLSNGNGNDPLQPSCVNAAIRGLEVVLRELVDGAVALRVQLGDVPLVLLDRVALHRVLINLVQNASDAMPHGGEVVIVTRSNAERVTISVTDSGCGIDPALQQRVFEPHFTNKSGRGRGLGLSSVSQAIEHLGGQLELHSRRGDGCRFEVHLPTIPVVSR
jgi:two-component system, cell cycle sensor histidine kinase and response regulator CckA